MPPLKVRAKPDTISKFERAATRRFAEAVLLQPAEPLGAVYLFGYSCEIRLKAAYYRLAGVPLHQNIEMSPPASFSPRKLAEQRVKTLLIAHSVAPAPPGPVGHHLSGWALAIEDARAGSVLGPFTTPFAAEFDSRVHQIWTIWAEFLRYCPFKPYTVEVRTAASVAMWFRRNYRKLWS